MSLETSLSTAEEIRGGPSKHNSGSPLLSSTIIFYSQILWLINPSKSLIKSTGISSPRKQFINYQLFLELVT